MDTESTPIDITKNILDCKDFDMRLRRFLMKGMSGNVRYGMTSNAQDALLRRAAEVTPQTVEMMIQLLPATQVFFRYIWHVQPEEVMEKIIRHECWNDRDNNAVAPDFIQDYCMKQGETLLKKYDKVPMILLTIMTRSIDPGEPGTYNTPSMSEADQRGEYGPKPTPEQFVKYIKRVQKLPKRMKSYSEDELIENLGRLVLMGQLTIATPQKQEVKANESTL